jgi:hypothetical protein
MIKFKSSNSPITRMISEVIAMDFTINFIDLALISLKKNNNKVKYSEITYRLKDASL